MANIIIENLVQIMAVLVITLIGVLGTWLTAKIGKKAELDNINAAQKEVIKMAQQTVAELEQTMVAGLKATTEDGKLSKDDIALLGEMLLDKTTEKMSQPTYNLLNAAGVNISELIKSAGEQYIKEHKESW